MWRTLLRRAPPAVSDNESHYRFGARRLLWIARKSRVLLAERIAPISRCLVKDLTSLLPFVELQTRMILRKKWSARSVNDEEQIYINEVQCEMASRNPKISAAFGDSIQDAKGLLWTGRKSILLPKRVLIWHCHANTLTSLLSFVEHQARLILQQNWSQKSFSDDKQIYIKGVQHEISLGNIQILASFGKFDGRLSWVSQGGPLSRWLLFRHKGLFWTTRKSWFLLTERIVLKSLCRANTSSLLLFVVELPEWHLHGINERKASVTRKGFTSKIFEMKLVREI